jgi:hypothetical protein
MQRDGVSSQKDHAEKDRCAQQRQLRCGQGQIGNGGHEQHKRQSLRCSDHPACRQRRIMGFQRGYGLVHEAKGRITQI